MVNRISGLASGMDIDSIVKKLMDAERIPLDQLTQKKTYTEWQRDDYRTINTALSELDTLTFDEIISKKGTFTQQTVTVSDPAVISVQNASSSGSLSGSIKVNSVATAASMKSTSTMGSVDPDALLSESFFSGVPQTLVIQAINKDGSLGSEKTIDIEATDTLNSLIDKINNNSDVTAFYDQASGQFSMTAKNTGKIEGGPEIILSSRVTGAEDPSPSDQNFFTQALKLGVDNDNGGTEGSNASVEYNGISISRASNTFTLNGAQITVNKKQAASDPAVTFSSTANPDKAIESIKKFVDSYNALIANIQTKIDETKNASYSPLTDAQKAAMTADQIKLWEDKAKQGTLHNDSTLKSLLSNMRMSLYNSVNGASFSSLSQIGITTTNVYQNGGKLQIDETKLRAALEKDASGVYDLFATEVSNTDATTGETTVTEKGLAKRLRDNLSSAMKDISAKAGSASSGNSTFALGRVLDDYSSKISSFQERLTATEDRYYKQFTAMEQAISKANSQSASLTSYFSKN